MHQEQAFQSDTTDSDDSNEKDHEESHEQVTGTLQPKLMKIIEKVNARLHTASAKNQITFLKEDFIIMTALCYVKKNVREHTLVSEKRAKLFWSAVTANFVTTNMLLCMLYAAWTNEADKYAPNIAGTFPLFQVKFPCALALHFILYPEVNDALTIMKFANQEQE